MPVSMILYVSGLCGRQDTEPVATHLNVVSEFALQHGCELKAYFQDELEDDAFNLAAFERFVSGLPWDATIVISHSSGGNLVFNHDECIQCSRAILLLAPDVIEPKRLIRIAPIWIVAAEFDNVVPLHEIRDTFKFHSISVSSGSSHRMDDDNAVKLLLDLLEGCMVD